MAVINPIGVEELIPSKIAAPALGFANAQSLASVMVKRRYPMLNEIAIYIGRRRYFTASGIEKFRASRTGAALSNQ
jgi:hypothetical protein